MGNKRVAIIGHFAENTDITDGQTVKTRILSSELEMHGGFSLLKVDTHLKNSHPVLLLLKSFRALFACKDVIVLLSGNGMRFYFPILSFFSRVFGTRVYHDVIGGNLDSYVEKYPRFAKWLRSFKINWVETRLLQERLAKLGVTNTEVIPNFKRLPIVSESELEASCCGPVMFCTFSRITREKGIELAVKAVGALNESKAACTLDIFGVPDDDYKNEFEELMKNCPDTVRYKGRVPFSESTDAIREYDALLFPTFWRGEGFPGTIVDAFSAGLPVLASEHGSNAEIVEDGFTGMLYAKNDMAALENAMTRFIQSSREELLQMKKNCVKEAEKYRPDKYVARMASMLSGDNDD